VLIGCPISAAVLLIPTIIQKMREAEGRQQSTNNLAKMGKGLHNVACSTPSQGYIQPSIGEFPIGGPIGSYFYHLLPYIEQKSAYDSVATTSPIKTYIAPLDRFNPGNSNLCSYASNATLLNSYNGPATGTMALPDRPPRMPNSFYGRTSGVIVVAERTAKGGQTWSGTSRTGSVSTNWICERSGQPDFRNPSNWQVTAPPNGTIESPTAFSSAGCMVLLGDGSARLVTPSNAAAGWAWAMDPTNPAPQPSAW
jgi:hypothetical protein